VPHDAISKERLDDDWLDATFPAGDPVASPLCITAICIVAP
jgi:hypothetical protein